MAIKMNMEVMELMFYFWQATTDREKVGEQFIMFFVDHKQMAPIYTDEFQPESVRRALSAISNREIFSAEHKCESRFWNNNMWAMEDVGLMEAMMAPLKVMNFDDLNVDGDFSVVVLPLHMEDFTIKGNALYVNFFRVQADMMGDDPLTMEGVEFKQWVEKTIKTA